MSGTVLKAEEIVALVNKGRDAHLRHGLQGSAEPAVMDPDTEHAMHVYRRLAGMFRDHAVHYGVCH